MTTCTDADPGSAPQGQCLRTVITGEEVAIVLAGDQRRRLDASAAIARGVLPGARV